MLIFVEMSMKPKEEVIRVKNNLCLSEDESQVFDMVIIQNKSAQEIADTIHKSVRTVFRIMGRLRVKIINEMNYKAKSVG